MAGRLLIGVSSRRGTPGAPCIQALAWISAWIPPCAYRLGSRADKSVSAFTSPLTNSTSKTADSVRISLRTGRPKSKTRHWGGSILEMRRSDRRNFNV